MQWLEEESFSDNEWFLEQGVERSVSKWWKEKEEAENRRDGVKPWTQHKENN